MIAAPLPFKLVAEQLKPPFGSMLLAWRFDVDDLDELGGNIYVLQARQIIREWN